MFVGVWRGEPPFISLFNTYLLLFNDKDAVLGFGGKVISLISSGLYSHEAYRLMGKTQMYKHTNTQL